MKVTSLASDQAVDHPQDNNDTHIKGMSTWITSLPCHLHLYLIFNTVFHWKRSIHRSLVQDTICYQSISCYCSLDVELPANSQSATTASNFWKQLRTHKFEITST